MAAKYRSYYQPALPMMIRITIPSLNFFKRAVCNCKSTAEILKILLLDKQKYPNTLSIFKSYIYCYI